MLNKRMIQRLIILLYFLFSPVVIGYLSLKVGDITELTINGYTDDYILLVATRAKNSTLDSYVVQEYKFETYSILINELSFPNISHSLFQEIRILFDASFIHSDIAKLEVMLGIDNKTMVIQERISEIYIIGGFLVDGYWFLRGRKLKIIKDVNIGETISISFDNFDRLYLSEADYLAITFRFNGTILMSYHYHSALIKIIFWRQIVLVPKIYLIFVVQAIFVVLNFILLWAYNMVFKDRS